MQRRLQFLTFAFCVCSTGLVFAQTQPTAEPKSTSGIPQTTAPANTSNPKAAPDTAPPAPPSPDASPTPAADSPASNSKETPQPGSANTASPGTASSPSSATSSTRSAKPDDKAATPTPVPAPAQPKTEILDSSATAGALNTDGRDPILDPPPFPSGNATLVGGIIRDVDRIRNRMSVAVFGGGRWTVFFDERTHIFRNGAETTQLALKKGERVYVDTMLDNTRHDIFARNIRVGVTAPPADADGQIMTVDTAHGEVTLRDSINSVPVHFGVDKETRISSGATPTSLQQIKPGALVHVKFAPESGNRGVAREIIITASPGAAFTFVGALTFLDIHRGLLAIHNITDNKNYDIHFSPQRTQQFQNLGIGSNVTIVATFEGTQYTAQSIALSTDTARPQQE